ncbi:MAG: hypothetical protein R8G01_05690 [Ilumatobacteraceae bacterium]|nr:hypothetical protein [Ilumatobacteraceae bacterium]
MGGRRAKSWISVAAATALVGTLALTGRAGVEAAPGDDAFPVPGVVALNTAGSASVDAVSCSSPGNCSAVGYYEDDDGYGSFVVSQVDGVWGTAIPVPGLATLNVGRDTEVRAISCTSDGNCSAGGYYTDAGDVNQAFVVSQVDGVWGDAMPVPGLAALNTGDDAEVNVLSCGAPGDCLAGGEYSSDLGNHAFVVSQVDGVWGTATGVPGLAALDVGVDSELDAGSCASAGNCTVAGYYQDADDDYEVFVASMVDGDWGSATQIPGLGALNVGGDGDVYALSCASPGNCSTGGYYTDASADDQAFVASQVDGAWGTAIPMPGLAALNVGGDADVLSISCTAPGYCSAGGVYEDVFNEDQGFVVTQTAGVWGDAIAAPGLVALNTGLDAEVESVACVSPGNCVAGGYYDDDELGWFGYYLVQTDGVWGDTIRIPGLPTLPGDENDAEVHAISCTSDGTCVGGGYYTAEFDPDDVDQAFLFEFPLIPGGTLQPLLPARLVESRPGEETVDGEFEGFGRVAAGSVTRFDVAGRGGVPDGADAAMLNVTAVFPDAAGFLTVWSCDGDVPVASSVNYAAGDVMPNAVLTALNDDGEACVYSLSATDVIVDVNGYVPVGGSPAAVLPARLVESRPGEETIDGEFEGFDRVAAGSVTRFDVAGRGGVPDGAEAVMLNVTAVFPDAAGFLTVWSCDGDVPVASSANYAAGDVAPNAVLTALNDDGEACIYSLSATDLIVDVNAAVEAGDQPTPVLPARLVESRPGEETIDGEFEGFGQVAAGSVTRFDVAGRGGVPDGADAAMLNVTAVFPDAAGFLTVWSCDGDVPVASSVNYAAGDVAPNAVLTALNDDGEACIYSLSATDLIVDVNASTD